MFFFRSCIFSFNTVTLSGRHSSWCVLFGSNHFLGLFKCNFLTLSQNAKTINHLFVSDYSKYGMYHTNVYRNELPFRLFQLFILVSSRASVCDHDLHAANKWLWDICLYFWRHSAEFVRASHSSHTSYWQATDKSQYLYIQWMSAPIWKNGVI